VTTLYTNIDNPIARRITKQISELEKKGIKLRPPQREVLENIASKIDFIAREGTTTTIAISAPTGIGKTLIGLLLANALDLPTLVAVRTRSQITSFLRDSVKFLEELPTVYLGKYRTCLLVETSEEEEDLTPDCSKCPFETTPNDPKAIEIINREIQQGIFDPYIIAKELMKEKICPYKTFLSIKSKIHIATYPYIVYPSYRSLFLRRVAPHPDSEVEATVLIDEAHNLDNFVHSPLVSISLSTIEKAILEARTDGICKMFSLSDLIIDLANRLKTMIQDLQKFGEESCLWVSSTEIDREPCIDTFIIDTENLEEIRKLLGDIVRRFREALLHDLTQQQRKKIRSYAYRVLRFYKRLFDIYTIYGDSTVIVYSNNMLQVRVYNPGKVFDLLVPFRFAILMSGTLPPPRYIINVWKIPDRSLLYTTTSYRLGKVSTIIDTSVTSRWTERNDETRRKYAKLIDKIFESAPKAVLAVFPSYEELRETLRFLRTSNYIAETRGINLGEVQNEVLKRRKVLVLAVAGGKLVEGIEFVDPNTGSSLLSDVIICGIPYEKPTPYQELVENYVVMIFGIDKWEYRNVRAWIKVRQALGRCIRSPNDVCRWWLLDWRFNRKWWRENLQQ